jgi:hypothetical protein
VGVVVELQLIEVGDLALEGVVGELEVGRRSPAGSRRRHAQHGEVGQPRHLLGERVRRREERVVFEREHGEAWHGEKRGPDRGTGRRGWSRRG